MYERISLFPGMDVKYDDEHALISLDDHNIRFTPHEFKLLLLLLRQAVVKEAVMCKALAYEYPGKASSRNLNKIINKIRSKLAPYGLNLHRVYGYGYMLLTVDIENEEVTELPEQI